MSTAPIAIQASLYEWKYVLTRYWNLLGYRGEEARLMASELSLADMAKIAKTRARIRNYSADEMSTAINKAIADDDLSLANRLLISAVIELGDRKKS